ncbi:hypothetical protein DICVIV_02739 [Dictyocaulus viviparus]|uniref:Transcription factor 25 n=1 Tax=Dictyocaulus viviparus TaxID=29172 RepID=A0A0D8Y4F0_DICVI|nr:hypothetical protein DICVIV_02739 [Dictyocaulus viviparus]
MSTKHLRRMLQEKEKQGLRDGLEVEETAPQKIGPVNRFAALETIDEISSSECSDEEVSTKLKELEHPVKHPISKFKRKTRKKSSAVDGEKQEELSDEQLLEKLSAENRAASLHTETICLGAAQLLKPDPRLFDAATELKRALGKTLKEQVGSSSRSHHTSQGSGRIVKRKNNWPPIRNIGLSMELDREDNEVKWFKFLHSSLYEKLERLSWVSEDSLNPQLIEEILADNPYHLNSLMLLANIFRMQDDITRSCDLIERGIFYCEQSMCSKFQVNSFYHRIDYLDYENRAFYLLLHRHMMNCIHKRCFETALNLAKLILTMDPQRDPLAILLLIDTIAIRSKQYKWLKDFYRFCKEWKNLNMLPNFCYSTALATFLDAKTDDDLDIADQMLTHAICAFPGVLTMLLDKLQIEPDATVGSHRYLNTMALNKETDGLKLVMKIYVNEIAEMWKVPETLSWLEHVARNCADVDYLNAEMENWKLKRQRLFVGLPPNIRRLAVLLGLESSPNAVTDPVPPVNGRARYTREADNINRPDSFLSGFLHSVIPDFDSGEHLTDVLQRLSNRMQQILYPPSTTGSDQAPQDSESNP